MHFVVDIDRASWTTVALGGLAAFLAFIPIATQSSTLTKTAKGLIGCVCLLGLAIAIIPFFHTANQDQDASGLSFVQPPNGGPRCNTFQGLGKVPDGYDLVVFDREVDAKGNAQGSTYYLDGKASKTQTSWQTPQIDMGAEHVEVSAVLVKSELASYLTSLRIVGPGNKPIDASWNSQTQPPGSRVEPSIVTNPVLTTPSCK